MVLFFVQFQKLLQNIQNLVKKFLGSVVPVSDNFFAALKFCAFTDGSFCYIPKNVRCPLEFQHISA